MIDINNFTREQKTQMGVRLADIFFLKRVAGGYQTAYGTKTALGVFNLIAGIAKEIEDGTFLKNLE
jgi:hypothetical protein